MKTLGIAFFLVGLVAAAFILGVTTNQTILMFGGFCAWTPAAAFVGWALARSGIRIIAETSNYPPPGANHRPVRKSADGNRRPRQPVQPATGLYDE